MDQPVTHRNRGVELDGRKLRANHRRDLKSRLADDLGGPAQRKQPQPIVRQIRDGEPPEVLDRLLRVRPYVLEQGPRCALRY